MKKNNEDLVKRRIFTLAVFAEDMLHKFKDDSDVSLEIVRFNHILKLNKTVDRIFDNIEAPKLWFDQKKNNDIVEKALSDLIKLYEDCNGYEIKIKFDE